MKATNYQHKNIRQENNKPGVIVIEGHIQGLANTRLLGREGIPVIVIDKNDCVAKDSRYCKKYLKCPDYLNEEFIEFLIKMNKAFNLENWLLLPSNDHAVYNISKNKNILGQYYKIITDDFEVVENIYNKRKLLQIAERVGIPIPKTLIPEIENPRKLELGYPLIIRGNQGLSFYKKYKQKAIIVHYSAELERLWDDVLQGIHPEEYFIQEIVPTDNRTISATVFSKDGLVYTFWMGIKLREHPMFFGTATCAQSIYDEDVLELSKKLIGELNFTGVCEIEWIRDKRDGIPKLIEVNPRTWLWVGLAAECGINYPKIIYNYIYNHQLPEPINYPIGVVWLNIYTDIIYSIQSILKKFFKPQDIMKTYRNFIEASWDKSDPLPFFKYALLINNFKINR